MYGGKSLENEEIMIKKIYVSSVNDFSSNKTPKGTVVKGLFVDFVTLRSNGLKFSP